MSKISNQGGCNVSHENNLNLNQLEGSTKHNLLKKYENCKQMNIELLTKIEKYRTALMNAEPKKRMKPILPTIDFFTQNNYALRKSLNYERERTGMQINSLVSSLRKCQAEVEKYKSDLSFEKNEYSALRQKTNHEKNQITHEFQQIINGLQNENSKLVEENQSLNERIEAIREKEQTINEETIEKLKAVINEQDQIKEQLIIDHEIRETELKRQIDALNSKYNYIKRQNNLNKREAIANKYKSIASKALYSKSMKKMSMFNVQNNEEVFSAIIQIMDKMRFNSNERIVHKNSKAIIGINKQSAAIEKATQNMTAQRNDSKINCGFCANSFTSKTFLVNHMATEHSFSFKEDRDDVSMDCVEVKPSQNELND